MNAHWHESRDRFVCRIGKRMVKKKKFRVVICIVSLLVSLIEKENWFPFSITLTVTTIYQVRDPYIRSHHIYLCCYVYMYMCLCLFLRVYYHSWSRFFKGLLFYWWLRETYRLMYRLSFWRISGCVFISKSVQIYFLLFVHFYLCKRVGGWENTCVDRKEMDGQEKKKIMGRISVSLRDLFEEHLVIDEIFPF